MMAAISTQTIIAVTAILAPIALGIYQTWAATPKRSRVKIELEILRLIGDDHEHSTRLRASVETQLESLYGSPTAAPEATRRAADNRFFTIAGLVSILLAVGTALLARSITDLGKDTLLFLALGSV